MKCPKCQTENPETRKFCRECGVKLSVPCAQCGCENSPGDRFCGDCGCDLAAAPEPMLKPLSFEEKLESLQRYLPGGLTDKILAQRGKIEGEHRQVTVMFCDLKGFTPLCEKLGEERVFSIIDELFEMMIHKVHEFGGTVNKGTGDGIMALFGAPIAVEDAPQRAIRSALAIQREMARFSGALKEQSVSPTLKMRAGIHTGPVVVGTLGNDLRVEFTALGDTVNLASRMEGLAEPGTVCVTEDTFRLTQGFFWFEALGERRVKGKEQPVKLYRVVAPSSSRTRFDVSTELGLTPFVGRDRELELLLDGFERARAGRGQAFSIMGEAGVGKSRLLYEFRKAVEGENATFLEGKCLSYSRGIAYHPIIDILKANFSIRPGSEDCEVRERIKQGLKQLGVDEANTLPYLLELLGVSGSGADKISMSPEGKRDRIMEAIKRISLKGSEIRPLVLAIEDLHWTDRSSEEAMKYMLESIPGARVFLVLTYRPEFMHTWGSRSYHSQITLNRLSNRETLAMLAHLLATDEVEPEIQDLVLEKTEGVPFFIEEFVRSLKDLKIIEKEHGAYHLTRDVHDVTIPGTIQDVIMARADSLPDVARAVLQAASAIEREFDHALIKRVIGLPEQELLSQLSVLKDAELIYERGIYPQSTYVFRHALTREVVYGSILAAKKRKLHLAIGRAMEDINEDSMDELHGVLAEHYVAAENYEEGAEHCRQAQKRCVGTASFGDAIALGQTRVACLERLSQTEEIERKAVDARVTLGLNYIQLNRHTEARGVVEPVVDLALRLDYKRRISQIYTIMGSYSYLVDENFPKAFEYLEGALGIAEEVNDTLSLVMASYWLGWGLALDCQYDRASHCLDRSLQVNIAAGAPWAVAMQKSVFSIFVLAFRGDVNAGYETSKDAVRLAEECGDSYSRTTAYISHGTCCYCKGLPDEAEQHLSRAFEFCKAVGWFSWEFMANFQLGEIHADRRDYARAQDYYTRAICLLEGASFMPSILNLGRAALDRARIMNNEKDVDLNQIFMYCDDNRIRTYEGWLARYAAESLLYTDDWRVQEAEEWVKKAIEADKRNGKMWELARDHTVLAEVLRRRDDLSGAREELNRAIRIVRKCGAKGWVERYENDLARI